MQATAGAMFNTFGIFLFDASTATPVDSASYIAWSRALVYSVRLTPCLLTLCTPLPGGPLPPAQSRCIRMWRADKSPLVVVTVIGAQVACERHSRIFLSSAG